MRKIPPTLLLALLCAALAAVGAVPMVDHTTHRVFEMVDVIPWSSILQPHWNEPPMKTWAVRPGSVLLLKTWTWLFGIEPPSRALLFLRGFAVLAAFGFGARAWLKATGLDKRVAFWVLLLPPTLFSAWLVPELDVLGAGLVLGGAACLEGRGRVRLVAGLALFTAAYLLKESSAVIATAFAVGGLVGSTWRRPRYLAACGIGAAVAAVTLAALVSGAGSDPDAHMTEVSWLERLPILEHNGAQLIYLMGPAAVVLLALPRRRHIGWPLAALAGLCAMPILDWVSHYEAVYATHRPSVTVLLVLLVLGLGSNLLGDRSTRQAATTVLLGWVGMSVAVLMAPNTREDIASRVFLALAVPMLALALEGVRRTPAWAALIAFAVWYPLASATGYTSEWRARNAVEVQARAWLADRDLSNGILGFAHSAWPVDAMDLRAAGADTEGLVVMTTPRSLATGRFVGLQPDPDGLRLNTAVQLGVPSWFVVNGRSTPEPIPGLLGDLSWTRAQFGVFTPIVPRDRSSGNLLEEERAATYGGENALDAYAASVATDQVRFTRPVWRPVTHVHEVLRRVATGLPLLERSDWSIGVYEVLADTRRSNEVLNEPFCVQLHSTWPDDLAETLMAQSPDRLDINQSPAEDAPLSPHQVVLLARWGDLDADQLKEATDGIAGSSGCCDLPDLEWTILASHVLMSQPHMDVETYDRLSVVRDQGVGCIVQRASQDLLVRPGAFGHALHLMESMALKPDENLDVAPLAVEECPLPRPTLDDAVLEALGEETLDRSGTVTSWTRALGERREGLIDRAAMLLIEAGRLSVPEMHEYGEDLLVRSEACCQLPMLEWALWSAHTLSQHPQVSPSLAARLGAFADQARGCFATAVETGVEVPRAGEVGTILRETR